MAVPRDNPYSQFNFTVDLGLGTGVRAGFQECSGIGMEVAVAEYRTGADPTNNVRKITGLNKVTDVTLKRGIIGVLELYQWLSDIRDGSNNGIRNVTIGLRSEDRNNADPVITWRLINARIIKYTDGPLNAKGNDVAMEELVLAYERLEVE
jgi:phage tail-like protein